MLLALAATAAPIAAAPDVNVGGELLRVILSLVAIIVVIIAAGWMTRRLQGRTPAGGGRRIRCVESFALGSRDRLLLIEADGKRLLVGAGQGGMRTLHVYEGQIVPDEVPPAPPLPNFGELLQRWKRKG